LLCAWLAALFPASAQVPGIISYQGKLSVNGGSFTGSCQFKFALVDAAGDTTYWSYNNTGIGGGEPANPALLLPVASGSFWVDLGDTTVSNMTQVIPASVFLNNAVYLRVWVNDGTNGSRQLSPDQRIGSAGYAQVAGMVSGVGLGSFAGNGSGLTNVSAANLTGLIPNAQLPANLATTAYVNGATNGLATTAVTNGLASMSFVQSGFVANKNGLATNLTVTALRGDGGGLTNLSATNLTGLIPNAQLPSNLATTAYVNSATNGLAATTVTNGLASVSYVQSGFVANKNGLATNLTVTALQGDGSGLTNLNAASLTGVLPSAQLPGYLATTAYVNLATNGLVTTAVTNGLASAAFVKSGFVANNNGLATNLTVTTIQGDGGGLTNLSAASLTGIIPSAQLPANLATTAYVNSATNGLATTAVTNGLASMAFVQSGFVSINSGLAINLTVTTIRGDGGGLTNISATNLTGVIPNAQLPASLATTGYVNGATSGLASVAFVQSGFVSNGNGVAGNLSVKNIQGDGSGLTNLNAASLTGVIPSAQLPLNLATTAYVNSATSGLATTAVTNGLASAAFVQSGFVANNNGLATNLTVTTIQGDGRGLTNLSAASLTGTLPSGLLQTATPSGTLLASSLAQDPTLVAQGYQLVMTVPAPGWSSGATGGQPSPRYGHTAVWDGQEMIIWGGTTEVSPLTYAASGAMYNPAYDLWAPLPDLGAPSARSYHTAIWTGAQMLVWGGFSGAGYLNTGGNYQRTNQSWSSISLTNAPTGRIGHVAVWTGSRMVIWGGENNSGLLNDGAVYDPAADQWTPLSLPNPPEARAGATAVWASDRMLVWGGSGASGSLSSGAQLLCGNNGIPSQWVAMAGGNAPAPREAHTAIWTGKNLLVWGGESGGAALGDGGAYDPGADAWASLPIQNAPVARFNHTAVWSGQEMLILGGTGALADLGSSSAYNPATGQWRALSNSGNPLVRTQTTGVWSGAEALVFGGQSGGMPTAALQRLTPQPPWFFYRKL